MNQTANQTTFDLMEQLLNVSSAALNNSRIRRQAPSPHGTKDPFRAINLFDEESQTLLYDLQSHSSFSKLQRNIMKSVSRGIIEARLRGWRSLLEDFKTFSNVAKSNVAMLHDLFNEAEDNVRSKVLCITHLLSSSSLPASQFTRSLESTDNCWPTEPNLNPLGNLFRSSADSMAQCFGRVFLDTRSLLDGVQSNFSTTLTLPVEFGQQFNYCESLNTGVDDVFASLGQATCFAKVSSFSLALSNYQHPNIP